MIAERQDGIAGLLAAYESKPALGAQRLDSLRCGLVASDPGASAAILAQIARDRRESNWGDALLTSGWRRLPAVSRISSAPPCSLRSVPTKIACGAG